MSARRGGDAQFPLALLGGSFDPVHHGHLRMALEAAHLLRAGVHLLPSGTPPHRAAARASALHRAAMLAAALGQTGAGRSPTPGGILLDRRELEREDPCYAVDTLREVRAEIGSQRPLVLLMGQDQFAALETWRDWQRLFELAHIGVIARAGTSTDVAPVVAGFVASRWTRDAGELAERSSGNVILLATTALDISSSRIRADLAAGRSPRWLLPDVVLEYIHRHDLYRTGTSSVQAAPEPPGT